MLLDGLFSSGSEQGLLSSCSARASDCRGFSCGAWTVGYPGFSSCGSQALGHRFNSCGTWAYFLRGIWDLFGSGIEPVFPTLVSRFFTTEPSEKPPAICYYTGQVPDGKQECSEADFS